MARQQLILIGLFMLAACAPTPAPAPPVIREVQDFQGTFACDDGQSVKMRFVPFQATIELQGTSVELAQKPIEKGFLYAGGGQTLRTSGSDVTWTDDKGVVRQCRDNRVAK